MGLEQGRFFILKTHKYSEADLLLQCLSIDGGRVGFIAKNALRSRKRFSGGLLEPTHLVQFFYRKNNREGALPYVHEALLLEDFNGLRKSYDRLTTALSILEMIRRVSQEGDKSSQFLFNLLGHSLKAIEKSQNLGLLKLHFMIKFLYQQGVLTPELWMSDFLKFKMSDSYLLETTSTSLTNSTHSRNSNIVLDYLEEIENRVEHYLQTASLT